MGVPERQQTPEQIAANLVSSARTSYERAQSLIIYAGTTHIDEFDSPTVLQVATRVFNNPPDGRIKTGYNVITPYEVDPASPETNIFWGLTRFNPDAIEDVLAKFLAIPELSEKMQQGAHDIKVGGVGGEIHKGIGAFDTALYAINSYATTFVERMQSASRPSEQEVAVMKRIANDLHVQLSQDDQAKLSELGEAIKVDPEEPVTLAAMGDGAAVMEQAETQMIIEQLHKDISHLVEAYAYGSRRILHRDYRSFNDAFEMLSLIADIDKRRAAGELSFFDPEVFFASLNMFRFEEYDAGLLFKTRRATPYLANIGQSVSFEQKSLPNGEEEPVYGVITIHVVIDLPFGNVKPLIQTEEMRERLTQVSRYGRPMSIFVQEDGLHFHYLDEHGDLVVPYSKQQAL